MNLSKKLYVTNRNEWRAWLEKHHDTETEVWLIYYKKHTNQPRILYDDAVEEALCFGWIDSIVQKMDEERFAQKFTPRKKNSKWSELNKQRVKMLVATGKMTPAGMAKIDFTAVHQPAPPKEPVIIPPFVEQGININPTAWANFCRLAPSYQRDYINWIMAAKREETRQRRLQEAITLLKKDQKLEMK